MCDRASASRTASASPSSGRRTVYRSREPIQVTLGFTQGRPGFLQRVGEFLGVLEPDDPVEVTFTDAGPDVVQTAFRAVALELPDLEPGEYTLHLRVDLAGREPAIASRPIIVMP